MLRIIKEFPYERGNVSPYDFNAFNAFSVSMVYFKDGDSGCLKGGYSDIEKYMNAEFSGRSYVVYHNIFKDGKSRQITNVRFQGETYSGHIDCNYKVITLRKKREYSSNTKHVRSGTRIVVTKGHQSRFNPLGIAYEKVVKRPPRCFPKEFNPYCEI